MGVRGWFWLCHTDGRIDFDLARSVWVSSKVGFMPLINFCDFYFDTDYVDLLRVLWKETFIDFCPPLSSWYSTKSSAKRKWYAIKISEETIVFI